MLYLQVLFNIFLSIYPLLSLVQFLIIYKDWTRSTLHKRKAPELTIPTAATATLLQTKASVSNRKPSSDESLSKRPKTAFGKRHSWPFLEPEGADDMVAGQSHPKKPKRVRDPLSVNTDVASSEENEQAFYSDYAVAPVRRRHTSGASPQQWSPITSKMAQGHQHQYSQQVDCSDESSSNDSLCILPVIHSFVPSALAQTDNHGPFVVPPASSALSLLRKNPDKSSEALSKEFGIYSDMKRQKADDSFMGMLAIKRAESGPQKGKDSKNQNKQRGLSYLDEQKGYPLAKDAATPASTPTVATGNREAPTVPAEPSAEEVTRKIATHIFGDVSPDKDDFAGASVMQEPTMDWD